MRRSLPELNLSRQGILVVALIFVLFSNTLVLGRSINLFRLPGERSELALAKDNAQFVINYLERTAKDQGLSGLQSVQDLIARLQYDVSRARNLDELAQVILTGSTSAKEVLDMENDGKRRELLQSIINGDRNVTMSRDRVTVTVSNDSSRGLVIEDQANVLIADTLEQIRNHPLFAQEFDSIAVEIIEGKARVVNYRTLYDRMKVLQQEVQTLQAELRGINTLSGYSSLTGAGVIVKIYDSPGGYTNDYIVHDADIRDIVNELYAAGAMGVAVGDQRLTATSSIRCAGSVVLVNQKQIPVNPVVIHAVGNPKILYSGLDLIKNTLQASRNIKLSVEMVDELTLPAAPRTP